jgi:pimeloyl-ACP methyl ester carboxylesterase
MPSFKNGPVEIAYLDTGEGEPIVLVHGFGSNLQTNWVFPSWVNTLTGAGRRVIALDNRGHGASSKLYDSADYDRAAMAEDVRALLDHLRIASADVMGYSMGARITANLAIAHPDRLRSAILGGVGKRLIAGGGLPNNIAEALEAPSLADVSDPQGILFRKFADQTKSDRRALAACIRGGGQALSAEVVKGIKLPVLIAVGTKDNIACSPHELADIIPGAKVLEIPDRDHMLAVGDKIYKAGVLKFLEERP